MQSPLPLLLLAGLSLAGLAGAPAAAAAGGADPAELQILDSGVRRTFVIARDEVALGDGRAREVRKIAPGQSVADVRAAARALAAAAGRRADLVLYEKGAARTESTRRVPTGRVLVRLAEGAGAAGVAALAGAAAEPVDDAPGYVLVSAGSGPGDSLELAARLRAAPGVLLAEPLLGHHRVKRWVPNDPLYSSQWHLSNTGQGGGTPHADINVTNAWNTYRGTGVMIGIVDDGLQLSHPDLSLNVNTTIDYDWIGNDANAAADVAVDYHGTACAGLAAGRGNNGVGVCGVAPLATLVGLRAVEDTMDDALEAPALAHSNNVIQIKSVSWGPTDDGQTLEGPGPLTSNALFRAATAGRGGKGTVLTWAAGNGAQYGDNVNYDGYANSIYTMAVGGIDYTGVRASYSERGACLVVCAPCEGGANGLITTDLTGTNGYNQAGAADGDLADLNYTRTFGGTSACAPIAAGVAALMLQARPALSYRDVEAVLMATARQVDPADPEWAVNGAGQPFNHNYGAGLIDAGAAVARALTWPLLGPQAATSVARKERLAIPDLGSVSLDLPLTNANLRAEWAALTLDVTHSYRGDLRIALISPDGMQSLLAESHGDPGTNYPVWTFTTCRDWGELSKGTWRLVISDEGPGDTGTVNSVRLEVRGTDASALARVPPVLGVLTQQVVRIGELLRVPVFAHDVVDGDRIALAATSLPRAGAFQAATGTGYVASEFTGVWTNTGTYSVTFTATDRDGSVSRTIQVAVTNTPATTFAEPFDGASLPAGWTVVTAAGSPDGWRLDNPGARPNYTGGEGNFAIADSDHAGAGAMDTELRSPVLSLANLVSPFLEFKTDFTTYSGADVADVDVSAGGAAGPWVNLWHQTGASYEGPVAEQVSLGAYAGRQVMIRFHYYNADYEYWWEVDDVRIRGNDPLDADGDRLPAWWERQYFGSPTGGVAKADSDRDGMTNLAEFRAGTDPNDPASRLTFTAISRRGAGTTLRWDSAYGRSYTIRRAPMAGAPFGKIAEHILATPPVNTYVDPGSTGRVSVYRVLVE